MLPLNPSELRHLQGDVAYGTDLIERRPTTLRAVEVPRDLLWRVPRDEGRDKCIRCLEGGEYAGVAVYDTVTYSC